MTEPRKVSDTAETEVAPLTRAPPAPPPTPVAEHATIADRYEILGMLGAGGMGSVYRVRDTHLDEIVALKLLRPDLADAPEMLDRFRREVRLARKVTHRNVARTYDIGEHEGGLLLTMELVEGESLATRLSHGGAMSIDAAIGVALDVCAGLAAAHDAGVVHRDLKPDNILLARDGRAVITDFGIARAHARGDDGGRTQGFVGTPAYMAPEQVEGDAEIDGRADLYALGTVIYEMITGSRAWPAPSPLIAAVARLTSPPPDPRAIRASVPDDLAGVVLKLLARRPDARFASADEVRAALGAVRPAATPSIVLRSATTPIASPLAPSDRTVAVLPPRALGVDEYLVDGLLEDLVDTLAMTRGLRVRPSGATLRYKGSAIDAREAGRELGVQVVVEASVRAMGTTLRVAARLVSVADGFSIWSRRFDRPASEILAVSDDVARAIAEALTADLDAPSRGDAPDTMGAELYLRARGELRAAWHVSERIVRVAEMFDEAIARCPRDPHVLAGGALAHARVAFFVSGEAAASQSETARDLAERAIALAPQLAEPWIALATLRREVYDEVGAVRALSSAIRLAPESAEARATLGRVLMEAGDLTDGIALVESALELDPSNDEPRWDLARALAFRGDFTSCFELIGHPVTTDGARIMRAYVGARLALWMPRGTAPATDDTWPGDGIVSRSTAVIHGVLRHRRLPDEGRAYITSNIASANARIGALSAQVLTELEMSLDAPSVERALGYARRAIERGLFDVAWMDGCPLLAPLRREDAWPALREVVDARAARIREARGQA